MAPSPTARAARSRRLAARLLAAATEHLPLKLAALFLSLLLWVVVSAEETTEELLPVQLSVGTDSLLSLRGRPPTVRALVVGRVRDILELSGNPLVVRRIFDARTPDAVALELRPSDVEVPDGVEVRVRDVQPRTVVLRFDVTTERLVPVRPVVRIRPDSGWRLVGAPGAQPESVLVRGPRAAVQRIQSIATVLVEATTRDSLLSQVALDTAGLGVAVRPARVRLRLTSVPTVPALPTVPADSASGAVGDSAAAGTPGDSATVRSPGDSAGGAGRADGHGDAGGSDTTALPPGTR